MTDTPTPKAAPPALSLEQRQAALEKGLVVRRAQSDFKKGLKDGSVSTADPLGLIVKMQQDDALSRLYVRVFLEAWPGFGKITAKKYIDQLKIAPNRRMKGLGREQREELAKVLVMFSKGEKPTE